MKQFNAHIKHLAILRFVRALLLPALAFLRGDEPKRYLRDVQEKLSEAENAVRRWLLEQAAGVEPPLVMPPGARDKKPANLKAARPARSFSVLPPPLRALPAESMRTPLVPFDTSWTDQRIAACRARAELVEAVLAAPERYIRRLAHLLHREDRMALSLRFLSARIALPGGHGPAHPLAIARDVPIDDSS